MREKRRFSEDEQMLKLLEELQDENERLRQINNGLAGGDRARTSEETESLKDQLSKALREKAQVESDLKIAIRMNADDAAAIKRQGEIQIQTVQERAVARSTAIMMAAIIYTGILTIVWLLEHWEAVIAIRQWFVNRYHNILGLVAIHPAVFRWIQGLLPDGWPGWITFTIPILVMAGAYVALLFALKALICRLRAFWKRTWGICRNEEEKRFKKTIAMAIWTAAVLLAVWMGDRFPVMNWFSWYWILAGGGTLAFHLLWKRGSGSLA